MNNNDLPILADLFLQATGTNADEITPMPGAGSNRRYYRLTAHQTDGIRGTTTLIGTAGLDLAENESFIYLSRHFSERGIKVPKVYAVSADRMYYVQDDLGDYALFDAIKEGRTDGIWTDSEIQLLRTTIGTLPHLQWEGANGLDFTKCHPIPAMDRKSVMWDLNYFKYCFFKAAGIEFDELKLEEEFECLVSMLLAYDTPTFMYRDFQSRNVIIDSSGRPGFIDFQGGRRGPYHYDVASFLWQAKARLPQTLREKLIDDYIEASREYCILDPEEFRKELNLFVLFRTLQVLGAYGFRGYVEGKQHFLQSIPDAIANLRELLKCGFPRLPYLSELLRKLTESERFSQPQSALRDGLTVRVNSFGFRKSGIPADTTGNGGGFVFDCRALHNPGRYDQYKQLTGLDQEVIDFLESNSGILSFLGHTYALVDNAVECYLQRGFTDLSVSFGCTGGRHRSVYCAAHMAAHIYEKFGCRVVLSHIEQGIKQIYEPK